GAGGRAGHGRVEVPLQALERTADLGAVGRSVLDDPVAVGIEDRAELRESSDVGVEGVEDGPTHDAVVWTAGVGTGDRQALVVAVGPAVLVAVRTTVDRSRLLDAGVVVTLAE